MKPEHPSMKYRTQNSLHEQKLIYAYPLNLTTIKLTKREVGWLRPASRSPSFEWQAAPSCFFPLILGWVERFPTVVERYRVCPKQSSLVVEVLHISVTVRYVANRALSIAHCNVLFNALPAEAVVALGDEAVFDPSVANTAYT